MARDTDVRSTARKVVRRPARPGSGVDGLLLAPINGVGPWAAIRALRTAMRSLSRKGRVRAAFLTALDGDGHLVNGDDRAAEVFILGYRVSGQKPARPEPVTGPVLTLPSRGDPAIALP